MYCNKFGTIMMLKSMTSGKTADTLAYGFSGNRLYHFSSIYLRPCAIRIENGKIKNTIASELKPVIIKQKTINIEAIELRDAKKPLVVENNPINPNAKTGRLINGERKTLSGVVCHENIKTKPLMILLKKCSIANPSAKNNLIKVSGRLNAPTSSATNPASRIIPTITSGNFGKSLIIKRRCGWSNTKNTQKIAKYIIYGVNMDSNMAIAKAKEYSGLGRFSPWIFEPSHNSKVGQKTNIINGVPEPERKRNGVESTTMHEASKDTLLLNQRLSSKINKNPKARPTNTLGNLTEKAERPNM